MRFLRILGVAGLLFVTTATAQDRDHDGIPDSIEGSVGTNPDVKDNDVWGNARLFAMQQYRDFLGREADAAGAAYWTGKISPGVDSRALVINDFLSSAEFAGTISPVARLYFAYFLRVPDFAGLDFWLTYSRSGNSLESISSYFAASPEFNARYGALDNRRFTELVYKNVLGREPDDEGRAFWVKQLDSGVMTRGQVMLGFSESEEYRAEVAPNVSVILSFMGMLRIAPDATEFTYWGQRLREGGTRLEMFRTLLNAVQYRTRFMPPLLSEPSAILQPSVRVISEVESYSMTWVNYTSFRWSGEGIPFATGNLFVVGGQAYRVERVDVVLGRIVVVVSVPSIEEVFTSISLSGEITEESLNGASIAYADGTSGLFKRDGKALRLTSFSYTLGGTGGAKVSGSIEFEMTKRQLALNWTAAEGLKRVEMDLEFSRKFNLSVEGKVDFWKDSYEVAVITIPIVASAGLLNVRIPVSLATEGTLKAAAKFQIGGTERFGTSGSWTPGGMFSFKTTNLVPGDAASAPQLSAADLTSTELSFGLYLLVNPKFGLATFGNKMIVDVDFKSGLEVAGAAKMSPSQPLSPCMKYGVNWKSVIGVNLIGGLSHQVASLTLPIEQHDYGAGCSSSLNLRLASYLELSGGWKWNERYEAPKPTYGTLGGDQEMFALMDGVFDESKIPPGILSFVTPDGQLVGPATINPSNPWETGCSLQFPSSVSRALVRYLTPLGLVYKCRVIGNNSWAALVIPNQENYKWDFMNKATGVFDSATAIKEVKAVFKFSDGSSTSSKALPFSWACRTFTGSQARLKGIKTAENYFLFEVVGLPSGSPADLCQDWYPVGVKNNSTGNIYYRDETDCHLRNALSVRNMLDCHGRWSEASIPGALSYSLVYMGGGLGLSPPITFTLPSSQVTDECGAPYISQIYTSNWAPDPRYWGVSISGTCLSALSSFRLIWSNVSVTLCTFDRSNCWQEAFGDSGNSLSLPRAESDSVIFTILPPPSNGYLSLSFYDRNGNLVRTEINPW
jgi:hypothetical protein